MTSEDAFRIIDVDFDQIINKQDLFRFLRDVLKVPEEELQSSRIDRLYNLMDLYRLGKVRYSDFKSILAEGDEVCDNKIVTGGRPNLKSSYSWKLKARQQIGYYLARDQKSITDSFDMVANNTITITYKLFKQW